MQRLAEPVQAAADHEDVESYAERGLALWAGRVKGHGPGCPCIVCRVTQAWLDERGIIYVRKDRPERGWPLGPEYPDHKRRGQP